ncbi:MAG: hypothetical protein K2Y29_11095 [Beijerinckiaceae bacterium]|nr:hypothetical protein [Beijerinckiaceae bacterium]
MTQGADEHEPLDDLKLAFAKAHACERPGQTHEQILRASEIPLREETVGLRVARGAQFIDSDGGRVAGRARPQGRNRIHRGLRLLEQIPNARFVAFRKARHIRLPLRSAEIINSSAGPAGLKQALAKKRVGHGLHANDFRLTHAGSHEGVGNGKRIHQRELACVPESGLREERLTKLEVRDGGRRRQRPVYRMTRERYMHAPTHQGQGISIALPNGGKQLVEAQNDAQVSRSGNSFGKEIQVGAADACLVRLPSRFKFDEGARDVGDLSRKVLLRLRLYW